MAYKQYASRSQMERDGWQFPGEFAECRSCAAEIEWAKSPKGKSIPMDPDSTASHFSTCPNANERSNGQSKPAQQSRPASSTSQSRPSAPATTQVASSNAAALKESMDELTVAVRALTRVMTERAKPRSSDPMQRNAAESTQITDEDIPF
jgi:single-stranded DNA-binding protein